MSVSATYRPPYCPKWPAASGSLRAADELLDLPMILPSRALLDARGDVDAERPDAPHRVRDGLQAKTPGDEQPLGGHTLEVDARERHAGPAGQPFDPRVDEDVVRRIFRRDRRHVVAGAQPERLDRAPRPAPAVDRVLVAVELHRREADLRRDALDQITRRIDEHADERRPGHGFRDRPGACHVDVARAAGPEIEAEKVRARADRGARVLGRADAADLHLHRHASHSARAAPGSGRSMNASPTRTACAPAAVMRRTSAAERSPLSATTSAPAGARGARRSSVARETAKVARSRLLIPTRVAPSAAARPSSASVCTSTRTSRPAAAPAAIRSAPCPAPTAATISSTASAPKARASSIWYEAISKSLRRQGSPEAARAATRCSSAPPKNGPSVSTESAAAPAAA